MNKIKIKRSKLKLKIIENKMKKNLFFLIILISIGGGTFYAGMKYSQSKIPQGFSQRIQNGIENRAMGRQDENSFVTGEIISKDDKSLTVKLRDGGSRIVFYSDTTEVSKFASGTIGDVENGDTIMITGKTNQDGSLTAQSIQIRPEIQNLPTQP